ncbi:MAG: GNAT family N-acetyltransferase [Bacteroidales bacterium]|nr:GNAT family N-acetyltransferase [Bacteroidales bacterium]
MMTEDQTTYHIREYCPGDFGAVEELWNLTGIGARWRGDTPESIEATLEKGGEFLVMIDGRNQQLMGTSWITTDGRRSFMHHFGIHPDYQGKGLANILLEKSLQLTRAMGLHLKIEVHQTNEKAINLYKKYGFNYLGDYNVYIIKKND